MPFVEKLLLVLSFTFHAMMIPALACILVMIVGKEDDEQRLLLTNKRIITCTLEIIIGIGLLIEIVFMVNQCKLCAQLFRKWRNCNSVIYVQNAPKIGRTLQQQQQRAVSDSFLPWNIVSLVCKCLFYHSIKSYVFIDKYICVLKLRHRINMLKQTKLVT